MHIKAVIRLNVKAHVLTFEDQLYYLQDYIPKFRLDRQHCLLFVAYLRELMGELDICELLAAEA